MNFEQLRHRPFLHSQNKNMLIRAPEWSPGSSGGGIGSFSSFIGIGTRIVVGIQISPIFAHRPRVHGFSVNRRNGQTFARSPSSIDQRCSYHTWTRVPSLTRSSRIRQSRSTRRSRNRQPFRTHMSPRPLAPSLANHLIRGCHPRVPNSRIRHASGTWCSRDRRTVRAPRPSAQAIPAKASFALPVPPCVPSWK